MFTDDTNRVELEAVLERAKPCNIHTNTEDWPRDVYPRERKPMSDTRRYRVSRKWTRIRKNRLLDFGHIRTSAFHVHHIDFDVFNSDSENLIPLWAPYHRWIHARAEMSPFYESLDRAVFLSVTKAWKPES